MKPVLSALALSAAVASIAHAEPPVWMQNLEEGRRLTRDASRMIRDERWREARLLLDWAVDKRPQYPGLWLALADAAARAGDAENARAALDVLDRMGFGVDLRTRADAEALRALPGIMSRLDALAGHLDSIGDASLAAELPIPGGVPEGVAWDVHGEALFVSLVRDRGIRRVEQGRLTDWTPDAELWSVQGLALDSRRRLLWAVTSALNETPDLDDGEQGHAALLAIDPDTGVLRSRFDVATGDHAFGDLVLLSSGDVVVSDAVTGELWRLRDDRFEVWIPAGMLASPQGLVQWDEDTLLVADYALGLLRVSLADGRVQPLRVPPGTALLGIDGLVLGNGRLLAIQNGMQPVRVIEIAIDAAATRVVDVTVRLAALPEFADPTLGTWAGDRFLFVANSHWPSLRAGGELLGDEAPAAPARILQWTP